MMNLNKRGVQTEAIHPICRKEVETVEHVILKCDLAKAIWSNRNDCPTRISKCSYDISDLALSIISQGAQSDLEKLFKVAWAIWYHRNQLVYEANKTTADQVWGTTIHMIEDFKNANNLLVIGKRDEVRALKPPLEGVFLINVDGAIPAMNGHFGVGVVIRD